MVTDYYHTRYEDYIHATVTADPSPFLEPFIQELPAGRPRVLDLGCGSGRDLLWLKNRGVDPVGVEHSPWLAEHARIHSGCRVITGDFLDAGLMEMDQPDGILLVGVLVHYPRTGMIDALSFLRALLKPRGTILITMKQGRGSRTDAQGRWFCLWQDPDLRSVFHSAGFAVTRFSTSLSALGTREVWLTYHLKRLDHPDLLEHCAARKLHHGPSRFQALFCPPFRSRFPDLLKWKFLSRSRFSTDYAREPKTVVHVDWPQAGNKNDISVTWLKHSSLLINDRGTLVLVDPVFRQISPLIRDFSPLALGSRRSIPEVDHVLITHGHYDHLDLASLKQLDSGTHVITPLGYDAEFRRAGMANRTQLDWFESVAAGGLSVTLLPCCHWTMRNPLKGPNRSLWGSYLIKTSGGFTIYVSGDTAWFEGYREIGRKYSIDLAIFNLGAYEPRWFMNPSHMSPEQTVDAFRQLRAARLMICHWGAFRLGDDPVHFPPLQLGRVLERQGMTGALVPARPGQTVRFG